LSLSLSLGIVVDMFVCRIAEIILFSGSSDCLSHLLLLLLLLKLLKLKGSGASPTPTPMLQHQAASACSRSEVGTRTMPSWVAPS